MAAGDFLLGKDLGAYRIDVTIGSGATGVVYRATPHAGGPPVALKVLHDNLGSITGLERRFKREARVLKKLSHPNIVEISEFGMEDGRTFIAMELLEGQTLEERLEESPLEPQEALRIYEPILEALAVAHEHDVVHRDLKPANVFLEKNGGVKLLDFGLAKMLSIDETASEDGTLTRKGRIVGTPAYMAPEQITGVFIDVRADVYALGVMLYELLADRRPFLYERRSELLRAHLLEPVKPIAQARDGLWVHEKLATLIERSLAKDAGKRFKSAKEMLEALRALPPDPVRFDITVTRKMARQRTGPSSAVISATERKLITESAGFSSVQVSPDVAAAPITPPVTPTAPSQERATLRLPRPPKEETPAVPTAALFVIAILLLGTAAGLWAMLVAT
ncbi:MAG: serine/threonine protein kinase [Sandaracinaceae bacterium]|nr:serine/threonine protein kinase [Sandaracinaceae bacterium]